MCYSNNSHVCTHCSLKSPLLIAMVLLLTTSHTTASPDDEQLVDAHTFRFAFLQTGFFATTAGLIVYFVVSAHTTLSLVAEYTPNNSTTLQYVLKAACTFNTVLLAVQGSHLVCYPAA
jgi:hypothetical protein